MEFALILRELFRHRIALAVGVVVALLAAVLSVYRLDGLSLKPRSLRYSSATTTVFIDTPSSVLGDLNNTLEPLQQRASAYGNFMASPAFLNLVGQRAGIPGDEIYAAGPLDPSMPRTVQEPTAVQRNVEITGETTPYRLNFNNDPNLPTIGIFSQAPTTKQAVALANGAAASLASYVAGIENANHVPERARVVVHQLGSPIGGVVDGGIKKSLAALAFVGVFVVWCVLILLVTRFRRNWRASASVPREALDAPWGDADAPPEGAEAPPEVALRYGAGENGGPAEVEELEPQPSWVGALVARARAN
jgi:hypothetical protein